MSDLANHCFLALSRRLSYQGRMFRPKFFELMDVCELEISIRGIKPRIWRTVRVPADLTLGRLHDVLQLTFGWTDSHLHEFVVHGIRFGMTDIEDEAFWASSLDVLRGRRHGQRAEA